MAKKDIAPNYTQEEDKAVCRAYVSASENPIKGSDQKADVFWAEVEKKFHKIMEDEGWKKSCNRDAQSLRRRFKDKIQNKVDEWIGYQLMAEKTMPSGTSSDDDLDKAVVQLWNQNNKTDFKLRHCVPELLGYARLNVEEQKAKEEDPSTPSKKSGFSLVFSKNNNKTTIGSKAAKQLKKEKQEQESDQQKRTRTFENIAEAAKRIADSVTYKNKIHNLRTQAKLYDRIGDTDGVRKIVKELQVLQEGYENMIINREQETSIANKHGVIELGEADENTPPGDKVTIHID